jgi:hypothetical protein
LIRDSSTFKKIPLRQLILNQVLKHHTLVLVIQTPNLHWYVTVIKVIGQSVQHHFSAISSVNHKYGTKTVLKYIKSINVKPLQ